MPSIELRNTSKYFGDVCAVDNVDLYIPDGAFFTLLGPSGCGKTTTLRMIAGLTKPTDGRITIGERAVFDSDSGTTVPPGKRGLGMVFQSYALWPHMTVWNNIAFPLQIKKWPSDVIKTKIEAVVEQLQIKGLENRYPNELSGGQQQRVAVARELVTGAEVLLMDEPLGNLDARLRLEMRSELKKLHHLTGRTIVYVTHDQLEAMTMSTHVAIMKDGALQQVSPPDEVYDKPNNLFVAEFMGDLPINLLEMEVADRSLVNSELGIRLPLPKINGQIKERLIAGIRPENVRLSTETQPTAFQCIVDTILPIGSEVLLRANIKEKNLNVLIPRGRQLAMGDSIFVEFDRNGLHLFDKETGNNVLV